MPPKLLTGKDADDIAAYAASVPGKRALRPGRARRAAAAAGTRRAHRRDFAMDLDGTVLDETFQPSARTAAAIASAEAAGIACLIATGRMFISARGIAEKLAIRRPLVCYQGALVPIPSGRGARAPSDRGAAPRELLRAMPE